ncbi:helix-turn-helix domain-containing protein [Microbacterium sp. NPDC056044]|uniref:helix-turn-helix domain-containing protein n=1 Tax=Microbacterium sp. NPDC056044 TaxID=3345690 RepID=UPI0035DC6A5D
MTVAGDTVHGSAAGYRDGCRSRASCRFHESPQFLTCAEAVIARRADFALSRLPEDQPIPRHAPAGKRASPPAAAGEGRALVHGTTWGYQRGCRENRSCPHWRQGKITCAEARRRYLSTYTAERQAGRWRPIEHGTSNGYLLGCRDPRLCPGDPVGQTCSAARAAYKRGIARAAGIPPRSETIDASEAARRIRTWVEQGLSVRAIAERTGVGRTTIADLAKPADSARRRVSVTTLQRILAD